MSTVMPNQDPRWHAEKAAEHMQARLVVIDEFERLSPEQKVGREDELGAHVEAHEKHACAHALVAMALKLTEDDHAAEPEPEAT